MIIQLNTEQKRQRSETRVAQIKKIIDIEKKKADFWGNKSD